MEDDMCTCDYCDGEFFPEDMAGDYCWECAEELFCDDNDGSTSQHQEDGDHG